MIDGKKELNRKDEGEERQRGGESWSEQEVQMSSFTVQGKKTPLWQVY